MLWDNIIFYPQDWHAPKQQLEELKEIINSQTISDCLHENDKELVWMMRYECRDKFSHALPLVLKSVKWNNHQDVAKVGIQILGMLLRLL